MSGFIYFVAAEPLSALKIGWSDAHPGIRLKQLQTGCPAPLKLLAFVDGSRAEECDLHSRFAALRIQGEWFRFEGDLKFLVNTLSGCPSSAPRVLFDEAIRRIEAQDGEAELDYSEAPLGYPFRGAR